MPFADAVTREQGLHRIKEAHAALPGDAVLRGYLLNDHGWSSRLDRHALEAIAGERKAVVLQQSLRGLVTSSAVLRAAKFVVGGRLQDANAKPLAASAHSATRCGNERNERNRT